MPSHIVGHFRAYLMRDGASSLVTDAQIEARDREQATSMALNWAEQELGSEPVVGVSLFLEIGDATWLVRRWDGNLT